jgi:hypothetical protein
MAITFDANSAASNFSQNVGSFNWSHAGGTPKGVIVFTFTLAELDILDGDNVTSVTYGGSSLTTASAGAWRAESINTPSSNEIDCKVWFLGSNVPTGTQTITVNRTNNNLKVWAAAVTVNSSQNSNVHSSVVLIQDSEGLVTSEQNVTDGSSGTGNSMRVAGTICELANFSTFLDDPINFNTLYPGGNSTYRNGFDFGNAVAMTVTETVTGTGSRLIGFSGDTCIQAGVYVAIKDVSSDGGGGATSKVIKDLIGGLGIIPFAR